MSTLLKGETFQHTLGQRLLFEGIGVVPFFSVIEREGLGTGRLVDNVYDEINRAAKPKEMQKWKDLQSLD